MKTSRVALTLISFVALTLEGCAAHASGVPLEALGPEYAFTDPDFNVPVRYDQTTQVDLSECILDQLFATGVTRLTGKVRCIQHDSAGDECNPGTIAQGLKVVPGVLMPRLVYSCRALSKAACPTDYVWQSLDYARLDPGPNNGSPDCSTVGTCVYRWKNNINWQRPWPADQSAVSGVFCNPDVYDAIPDGPCSVEVTETHPGLGGVMPTYTIEQSTSGASVTCRMVKNEPGGSSIKGKVTWQGTCRIRVDAVVAPEKACQ